jgi:WD40 repeat protein
VAPSDSKVSAAREAPAGREALVWLCAALKAESHNLIRWPGTLWQQLDNRILVGEGAPPDLKTRAAAERDCRRTGSVWFGLDAPPEGMDDASLTAVLAPRGTLDDTGTFRTALCIVSCASRGDVLVVGANDGTVRLLRSGDLVEIAGAPGHRSSVLAACWIAEGARFVSAGMDGTACVWDTSTLSKVMTVETGQGILRACSGAANCFATGGSHGTAAVWDAATGSKLVEFPVQPSKDFGEIAVALSRNGRFLAAGGENGSLRVWSVSDGRQVAAFDSGQRTVRACSFAQDDTTIVSCGAGGKLNLWKWASSEPPATLFALPYYALNCLSYDAESDHVVFGGDDGVVRARALSKSAKEFEVTRHSGSAYSCSVTGGVVFSGSDGGVVKRSLLAAPKASQRKPVGHYAGVTCCAIAAAGGLTATGEGRDIVKQKGGIAWVVHRGVHAWVKLWARDGTPAGQLPNYGSGVIGFCFSLDGLSLLAIDDQGYLTIWSTATRTEVVKVHSPLFHGPPVLSADSRWLAVISFSQLMGVYDLHTPVLDFSVSRVIRSPGNFCSACFSPSGSILACGTSGGSLELWREPWKTVIARTQAVSKGGIRSLVWTPDGKALVCGTTNGRLVVCDATSLEPIETISGHTAAVVSCAFAPEGDVLFTASEDGSARAWRWPGGTQIALLPTRGIATCVAAAEDRSGCAGDEFGAVYLFHLVGTHAVPG